MGRLIVFGTTLGVLLFVLVGLSIVGTAANEPFAPKSLQSPDNVSAKSLGFTGETSVESGHPRLSTPPEIVEGDEHRWRDGDRTLTARVALNLAVASIEEILDDDEVMATGGQQSIVVRRPGRTYEPQPVFVSSGGGLMTLPGGVVLVLRNDWDEIAVNSFFDRNNIASDRVSKKTFAANGFLIETDPGFPSLSLANSLAPQDGVKIAIPNWSEPIVLW